MRKEVDARGRAHRFQAVGRDKQVNPTAALFRLKRLPHLPARVGDLHASLADVDGDDLAPANGGMERSGGVEEEARFA